MTRILKKVGASLEGICGVPSGARIIVAVSGGPDSVFLLDALPALTAESHWELDIFAAHLDHGLRGEESRLDRQFVADLCAERNVPLTVRSIDLKSLMKSGESIEQAARRVRYQFLEETAVNVGAKWITTGHTADDQAETLLLRIGRGTGIEGLRGIIPARPVSRNSPVTLVRPILEITRVELVNYLEDKKILWRTDSTNTDIRFARNRIRRSLSAVPEENTIRLRTVLCSAAVCALRDWPGLQQAALDTLAPAINAGGPGIEIDIARLDLSRKELTPYVIREIIRKSAGDLRRITQAHVLSLQNLISAGQTVGRVDLPNGITAIREYGTLRIGQLPGPAAQPDEVLLLVPGKAVLPDGTVIEAALANGDALAESRRAANDAMVEYVDGGKITPPLKVRYRKPGDRFRPLGSAGEKKLKDFLIDKKVPRSRRNSVPLLTSGDEIVWVAGHRINEKYKLDAPTKTAIRLQMCRKEP